MHTAYIGIGSNLGDRLRNCRAAIDRLASYPEINITRVSRWYETGAIPALQAGAKLPDYVNGAAEIETSLSPEGLLATLQEVEAGMGRTLPRPKGQPRTMDLDLLLFGAETVDMPGLAVPHPGLSKRLFVLLPLCDIAPDAVDPRSGLTAAQMKDLLTAGDRRIAERITVHHSPVTA
ncbi:MAG: 2-amino-4-hydroxy-6-hydroxymethyldihydropteridine diphosphokinase [Proteobacteria bacterium]|nr:2-amino-4-hydroxy-6-hydroxymethyldihydropteridine diphosphokinase [Pseudomonadota bacterium]